MNCISIKKRKKLNLPFKTNVEGSKFYLANSNFEEDWQRIHAN